MSFQKLADLGAAISETNQHNKHLSLSVSKELFCVSILDVLNGQYDHFKVFKSNASSYAEQVVEINNLLSSEDLSKFEFKSVSGSLIVKGNTLVPKALFHKEKVKEFHDFSLINVNVAPTYDFLTNLNAYNIYGVVPELEEVMLKFFPSIKLMHYSSILIESFLTVNSNNSNDVVYVTVFDSFFDLTLLREGNLLLNNSFKYQTVEDIAYYLLFVCKELSVELDKISISVFGNKTLTDQLKTLIDDYVLEINTQSIVTDVEVDQVISENLVNEFPELFNQYRCV